MSAQDRPNIILIFTDQHRLSAAGCYGDTVCKTPNIDRLAAEGVRFETAYTSCPVCSPARATILTGLHIHAHGVCSNSGNLGSSVHELRDRPELLSRRLIEAGYRCGYTGKWHLGGCGERVFRGPNEQSLPSSIGFEGQDFPGFGRMYDTPEYREFCRKGGFHHEVHDGPRDLPRVWPYGILEGPEESTVPYFLADHTISLIDRYTDSDQPFFISHNFWGPHGPYFVPQAYYDMYRDVEIPPWPNFEYDAVSSTLPLKLKVHALAGKIGWEPWAEAVRHYYALTTLIDRQIGRMLDHLEQRGIADNTVVIFTSDHGQTLGSHGGLTDKGWHHFEEIQRIPFIVRPVSQGDGRGAGRRPRGSVAPEWTSLLDVYPTILGFAGIDTAGEDIHGKSLVPLLRGESVSWPNEAFVEFNGVNSLATSMITCRKGDLKYGWNCSNEDELYDLSVDPREMVNRIVDPDYADAAVEMRSRIEQFMVETRYPGPALKMYQSSRMGAGWA